MCNGLGLDFSFLVLDLQKTHEPKGKSKPCQVHTRKPMPVYWEWNHSIQLDYVVYSVSFLHWQLMAVFYSLSAPATNGSNEINGWMKASHPFLQKSSQREREKKIKWKIRWLYKRLRKREAKQSLFHALTPSCFPSFSAVKKKQISSGCFMGITRNIYTDTIVWNGPKTDRRKYTFRSSTCYTVFHRTLLFHSSFYFATNISVC